MGNLVHYVITDGKQYIGYDETKQKNIIVDTYKKAVKLRYRKINLYNKLENNLLKSGEWKIISSIEAKTDLTEAVNGIDIASIIDTLEVDFDLLEKRKKVLEVELLEIEREITDIYHAMEFYNLDAAKEYKIYKMMQERLIRRRQNKDEMLKINYILNGGINGLTSKETRKHIESMENRYYQLRVLKELFEV